MRTLTELRTNIASTVRETQINSLITDFINITLSEIHNASDWTWLRRKTTFATVASQEKYNLDEEVDRITLLRQNDTPRKLMYVPDHIFYEVIPNPEDLSTSSPTYYRLWEETGFVAQPIAAETITIVSSSTADTAVVVIDGRESTNGLRVTEEITLNGTTPVASSNTYAIDGLIRCSKSTATTGTVTITGTSSSTVMAYMSPEERAPRYKRLGLYPIPSSVITMYLEYLERYRPLVKDGDTTQLDYKWMWVVREGALAKVWEYKQNEQATLVHQRLFDRGIKMMIDEDSTNLDYIPSIRRRMVAFPTLVRVNDGMGHALRI